MDSSKREHLAKRVSSIPLKSASQQISELAKDISKDGRQIVNFTIGEPCFDTPANITSAAIAALEDGQTHYTSNLGSLTVREAFAAKLARDNNLTVDPNSELTLTNGGKLSIYLSLMTILDHGHEVLVTDPCFGSFSNITKLAGGKPVYAACVNEDGRFRPDLESLERMVTERTRAIVINSPCNPTGTVLTKEELMAVGDFARQHDLWIISDETYEKIIYGDHVHYSIGSLHPEFPDRTITIGSLSKTYGMTGWRVGFIAAPARIIKAAAYLNQNSARMASAFVQHAAKEAYSGSQDAIEKMVEGYRVRSRTIVEGLESIPGIACVPPEGTFYVFLQISQFGLSSLDFAKHLVISGGVASTPGHSYGPAGEGYIRLSFATEISEIEKGIEGISKALKEL